MARVTSNLEVTIPEELARECGIKPGDEVEVSKTESGLRITLVQSETEKDLDEKTKERLRLFDESMARQVARQRDMKITPTNDRGWTREELYEDRGFPRRH